MLNLKAIQACLNPCFNGILKYLIAFPALFASWACLNPCFNGILKYQASIADKAHKDCLNPCFNGILKYVHFQRSVLGVWVLILVLMEY